MAYLSGMSNSYVKMQICYVKMLKKRKEKKRRILDDMYKLNIN